MIRLYINIKDINVDIKYVMCVEVVEDNLRDI